MTVCSSKGWVWRVTKWPFPQDVSLCQEQVVWIKMALKPFGRGFWVSKRIQFLVVSFHWQNQNDETCTGGRLFQPRVASFHWSETFCRFLLKHLVNAFVRVCKIFALKNWKSNFCFKRISPLLIVKFWKITPLCLQRNDRRNDLWTVHVWQYLCARMSTSFFLFLLKNSKRTRIKQKALVEEARSWKRNGIKKKPVCDN